MSFWLVLKAKTNRSLLLMFWKLQFNENEKNFQLSFWLCFHIFSESRNSTKMKRTFNCNFDFVFTAQARLALLSIFFESRNSMKMKRTFSRHFGFTFKVKVRLVLLMTFFESRNSIKMKNTFKVKVKLLLLVIFFESHNSMKMKRTFNLHFGFVFTARAWLSLLAIF